MAYKKWKKPEIEKKEFDPKYPPSMRQDDCISVVSWILNKASLSFTLIAKISKFNKGFSEEIKKTVNALVVMACAGAGKTTLIMFLLDYICNKAGFKGRILVTSFANSIVKELEKYVWQFRGSEAKGLHGLGYAVLFSNFGKLNLLQRGYGDAKKCIKTEKILEKIGVDEAYPWDKEGEDQVEAFKCLKAFEMVVHFIKVSLTDWKDERAVANTIKQYNVELDGNYNIIISHLSTVMEESLKQVTVIDFDDMIWLPIMLELKIPKFDIIIGDECQDYSAAQIELIRLSGALFILVGDRYQAIYGFAGADIHSVDNILAKFQAIEMPLDVNYRCDKAIVLEAQKVLDNHFKEKGIDRKGSDVINPWEGAGDGHVEWLSYTDYLEKVKPGDFIGCRNNAPLVSPCYKLIKSGKRATIKGKSIADQIINMYKKVCKDCDTIDACIEALEEYREKEIKKVMKRYCGDAGSALDSIGDKVDTLVEFVSLSDSPSKVIGDIEDMFSSEDKITLGEISLGSCHYSKGLEFDRCFFLEWDNFMTMRENSSTSDYEQRVHLKYIAITRAKHELYYVRKPPKGEEDEEI